MCIRHAGCKNTVAERANRPTKTAKSEDSASAEVVAAYGRCVWGGREFLDARGGSRRLVGPLK